MGKWKLKRSAVWEEQKGDWMPLSALVAMLVGFLAAYIIAETTLYEYQHPLHWVVAFAGGTLGYLRGLALENVLDFNIWRERLSVSGRTQTTRSRPRFWEIDAVRGIAVVMMVIYHLMYDLYFFQITNAIFTVPFWFYFQRVTAGTFIILVGVSLAVLAQRAAAQGSADAPLFWQNIRRGLRIFGWGLVITLATRLLLGPDLAITFGILHFIGVAIAISYPFLRLRWLNLGLGLAVYAMGVFLHQRTFDLPYLVWLGFEPENHIYVDYFPIFPWFGVVLIGMSLGNLLYDGNVRRFVLPGWSNQLPLRWLEWLGLRSLPIYLLHQIALFALLIPLLWLLGVGSVGWWLK